MLSIAKMSSGQEHYYTELAREDYYLKGGEPPGHWLGKGAKQLELEGEVTVPVERFEEQMAAIERAGLPGSIPGFQVVNAFEPDGRHRDPQELYKDILEGS